MRSSGAVSPVGGDAFEGLRDNLGANLRSAGAVSKSFVNANDLCEKELSL
jgi:hypothetical protein